MDQLDNVYDKIKELLNGDTSGINIVEESIDVDLQFEYLEFSKNNRKNVPEDEIEILTKHLLDDSVSTIDKKQILVDLAGTENVNAFRAIESYTKDAVQELSDWSKMAYRESKMHVESSLLETNQVVISSGLGGKAGKLRYFIVFRLNGGKIFSELQQNIITRETNFYLTEKDGEVEEVFFYENFTAITAIIPLDVSLRNVFSTIANECNSYGNFLKEEFLITNVKKMTGQEIKSHFNNNIEEN